MLRPVWVDGEKVLSSKWRQNSSHKLTPYTVKHVGKVASIAKQLHGIFYLASVVLMLK